MSGKGEKLLLRTQRRVVKSQGEGCEEVKNSKFTFLRCQNVFSTLFLALGNKDTDLRA